MEFHVKIQNSFPLCVFGSSNLQFLLYYILYYEYSPLMTEYLNSATDFCIMIIPVEIIIEKGFVMNTTNILAVLSLAGSR